MPLYYSEIHFLSKLQIGLLLGMNGFVIVLLEMPLIAWLEKRANTLTKLMFVGMLLTGISFNGAISNSLDWNLDCRNVIDDSRRNDIFSIFKCVCSRAIKKRENGTNTWDCTRLLSHCHILSHIILD